MTRQWAICTNVATFFRTMVRLALLRAALRAEFSTLRIRAAVRAHAGFGGGFDLSPAVGAELGAVRVCSALGAKHSCRLDHLRSALRAELRPGSGQCAVFGACGQLGAG